MFAVSKDYDYSYQKNKKNNLKNEEFQPLEIFTINCQSYFVEYNFSMINRYSKPFNNITYRDSKSLILHMDSQNF